MPWKTEIDRLVHNLVLDAAPGGEVEVRRAVGTVTDLLALAPARDASWFHAGTLDEIVAAHVPPEQATPLLSTLPPRPARAPVAGATSAGSTGPRAPGTASGSTP